MFLMDKAIGPAMAAERMVTATRVSIKVKPLFSGLPSTCLVAALRSPGRLRLMAGRKIAAKKSNLKNLEFFVFLILIYCFAFLDFRFYFLDRNYSTDICPLIQIFIYFSPPLGDFIVTRA